MVTAEAEAASAALFMMIWCVAFIDQPGLDTTTVAKDPTCLPHHPRNFFDGPQLVYEDECPRLTYRTQRR